MNAPTKSRHSSAAAAWDDLDRILRQLDHLNDIAIGLEPGIRKLAPDGAWHADRLELCNGAVCDYIIPAREAVEVLQASSYGNAGDVKGGPQ